MSSSDRGTVILLQAKQALGSVGVGEFAAAVAAAGARLRIVRSGEVNLLRDSDVPLSESVEERIADIEDWRSLLPADTSAIVTNDEYLLGITRALCAEHGLPTTIPASWENYRHKGTMRRVLEAAGLPVTESLIVTAGQAENAGGPAAFADADLVVVKPDAEANLRGIRVERFADVSPAELGDGLIERRLPGPQYHSEVLVSNGVATHLFSGLYIRPLLDLTRGIPSGSARVEPELEAFLAELAVRTCTALGLDGAFTAHVEYLSGSDDPVDIVVSEVCARASGGEVPFQSRIITGTDLELLNLSIQCGLPCTEPTIDDRMSAGWLWHVGRPIEKTDSIQELGVEAAFDSIALGGRARISGGSVADVLAALEILATANEGGS